MPPSPIAIDRAQMSLGSPPAELEIIAPSPRTPWPPSRIQEDGDGASDGGEGDPDEFRKFSDQELQLKIVRMRALQSKTRDGGEKSRKFVRRVEKELDRRRAAGPIKVDTGRRLALHTPSRDDSFTFNSGDELNCSNSGDKRHHKSYFAPPTKNGKADGAAFSSEIEYYMPKKPGERARKPVELNRRTVRQNTTDNKLSDMDGRRLGLKICSKIRQKNNNVGLKGMSDKRHTEDDAFEIFPKRFGNSKNQTYQCEMLNKRDKNKEVVLLDDEDAEPAKSVDVEMANEWDKKSEIYYPSRADPESVVLTYSDIECLKPAVFLKSPVINFYIQYLKRSWPCGDLYIFSTYLYSKLEKALLSRKGDCDSQFEKLRRWWKSVDIFRTPYLLLPIHGEMHWSLVIICMPTKERESGPTVFHLDSLGLHPSDKIFRVIESYLKEEWSYLQKDPSYDIPFSGTIWRHLPRNIYTAKVEVPRQRNDYDCGIFMLYYIEKFIQEAPDRLTRERPCKFGRKWFNPEETWGLRERMRALLFDVFQNTPLNDRDSESHSNDHSEGDDKDEVRTVTIIS